MTAAFHEKLTLSFITEDQIYKSNRKRFLQMPSFLHLLRFYSSTLKMIMIIVYDRVKVQKSLMYKKKCFPRKSSKDAATLIEAIVHY